MSDATKLADDDHARGCEGRCYTCTCGYDDRAAAALRERDALAAEVERLKQRVTCPMCDGAAVNFPPAMGCALCGQDGKVFQTTVNRAAYVFACYKAMVPQLAAYKAMADELAAALGDCATDLEAELEAQTPVDLRDMYPSMSRKFSRDMQSVEAARTTLTRYQAMKDQADGPA